MVQHHDKVAHIPPRHDAYLNLGEEMIAKAPIVDAKFNFKMTQDILDKVDPDNHCDTFKINNALLYQNLQNRERVCRMVKQCTSTFISDFLALTV